MENIKIGSKVVFDYYADCIKNREGTVVGVDFEGDYIIDFKSGKYGERGWALAESP